MNNRIIKKLLAVFMIITILATDFFVLGSNLISYAVDNKSDIELVAYFKEEDGNSSKIAKSIKTETLSLYIEVKVNGDGYLSNGTINMPISNFNIKDEILPSNKYIKSIDGNTVNLKQINEGEVAVLELGIEPKISDKMNVNLLSQETTIKLAGTYMEESYKGIEVDKEEKVTVNYQVDETAKAELITDIITNKVLSVDGENKRVVQLLIKSRLTENQYPIQQTKLDVTIPQLGEQVPEVSVLAIGELASNGETQISAEDWKIENGILNIEINNNVDENNEINWKKNAYDELIVTYLYPENVDATKIEATANSELKLYNSGNTYTARYTKGIENQEPNNVIMGKTEITTQEMYKGQIYANIDAPYNTKTTIVITNSNVADEIKVHEGPDTFATTENELTVNTKYLTTEVNLNKMLEILGQDGNIQIKNGETVTTINKESEVDENGLVLLEHENSATELYITTSKPAKKGILEINHSKAITKNSYSREELKTVKSLNVQNTIEATLGETKVIENNSQSSLELKETVSKAELTIDKTTLSATEANEVTVGIKLITDGAKYDLFKNPSISIKFPETVESIQFIDEPNKLYADEFSIINQNYDASNKILTINMEGEQIAYPESSVNQAYIQLKLKVTIAKFVISQTDKISMTYTNENTTEAGVIEQSIEISAPNELIKMFNLSSNSNTSTTEKILQQVNVEEAGKEFNFDIVLINNKDTEINNVKILGKLPTTGNTITEESANTLETIIKTITAENATIYYTENVNATENLEDSTNGWTQDLTTLTNAKSYLIKLDTLARGAKYTATATIQMSNPITENALSYTQYEVIYDAETETGIRESSRKIGLASSKAASINVETTAQVGQQTINTGDTVKEGEVIKYTVTVTNKGIETLKNIQLKLAVPEGTVYVKPIEKYIIDEGTDEQTVIEEGGFVYAENAYYEEITDNDKLSKLTNITISELLTTTPYVIEYEVRVNKGTAGKEILNKSVITYNESTIEAEEIKNMVKEANVRVTVKRAIDVSEQLYPNGYGEYVVLVENLSSSKLKNLEMQIISEGFKPETIEVMSGDAEVVAETIKINKLGSKDDEKIATFRIYGKIKNVEKMSIYAKVNDSEGEQYRSNKITEMLPQIGATISMTNSQNGAYIKEGDTVEYNVIVKNTGTVESVIQIVDVIPEQLEVQEIYVNNELKEQKTEEMPISNNINYPIVLKPQEQAEVKVITKVGYISETNHGKTITNKASAKVYDVIETNSEVITHVLKASEMINENIENIISGFAWFDANANGIKDSEEDTLSGITVKLYDIIANHYISDEHGNPIEMVTENDGEYTFTKIPAGSYLINFEYDTEKYEFTAKATEGVDSSLNSKVELKQITTSDAIVRVAAIELSNLNGNSFNMNIGLKENTGETPAEKQPGIQEIQKQPENSETETDKEDSTNSETTEEVKQLKNVSGFAWLDSNRNGQKDDDEKLFGGIKVKLFDVTNQKYIAETTTNKDGKYEFNNIEKGLYIIVFEYDTEEYEPTTYMAEGVDNTGSSKAVLNNININGQQVTVAVTDTINVQNNVSNINIGLRETLIFDLELKKYISKIVVQTSQKTRQYEYKDDTFEKVEIHRKQLQGAIVVLEYTIKVKNNGEMSGYAKNIVDYLPSGLTFSSELNKDWYLSGNNLYTKSLENVELKPGEEKEIKLILTKTMTNDNVGLINNRAEIYQDYNKYGEEDIDSTPNNKAQNEDDFGAVDVIIQVATGGGSTITYFVLLMINAVLIGFAIKLMIKNRIIKRPNKKSRR